MNQDERLRSARRAYLRDPENGAAFEQYLAMASRLVLPVATVHPGQCVHAVFMATESIDTGMACRLTGDRRVGRASCVSDEMSTVIGVALNDARVGEFVQTGFNGVVPALFEHELTLTDQIGDAVFLGHDGKMSLVLPMVSGAVRQDLGRLVRVRPYQEIIFSIGLRRENA